VPAGPDRPHILISPPDEGTARALLALDPATGRVVALELGGGEDAVRRTFSAQVVDPDLPVPTWIEVRAGGELVERVEVEILDLDPPSSAWPTEGPGS